MKIAAVCCTYLRPKALGRLIHCFLQQDYPKRELIILDDAGQYDNQQGDRWRLISVNSRFPTLGEKRNAAVALVADDVEALAVWDDDDLYLPWALRACAEALRVAPWSRPSIVLHPHKNGSLTQHKTCGLFHGGWAYMREVFERIGGYPPMNNGEDQAFARRLQDAGIAQADPCACGSKPFYIYCWGENWHLSGMGGKGYQQLGGLRAEKMSLTIAPPKKLDLHCPKILQDVCPRMF